MAFRNTQGIYGGITKLFHWLIALLVIIMLMMGVFMGNIKDDSLRATVYGLHKSFGILILALILLRLLWRISGETPLLPSNVPKWQVICARISHWLFYVLLILMPISGWTMSTAAGYPPKFFNLFTMPVFMAKNKTVASLFVTIHEVIAWMILALIIVHVLAALKHHFINKDNVLRRMLPFSSGHDNLQ